MLKRRLCEARFEWELSCDGPLLIADGRYEKRKSDDPREKGKHPDKVFISRASGEEVRQCFETARSAGSIKLPFYVPGTSLRGPLRAQAERILRTVIAGDPPASACDPFADQGAAKSCSRRFAEKHAEVPYEQACPACKLFGCTGAASRIQLADADVDKAARSVFRDMIGIDRFTGGVFQGETDASGIKKSGGANMRFHALEGASFTTTVSLTNFELWHLGLLAFVFRDFAEGLVSIGFGKTKGFGQVKGRIRRVALTYPKGRQQGKLQHLDSLATESERKAYGLFSQDAPEIAMTKPAADRLELFETFEVSDIQELWTVAAPAFTAFVETRQAGVAA